MVLNIDNIVICTDIAILKIRSLSNYPSITMWGGVSVLTWVSEYSSLTERKQYAKKTNMHTSSYVCDYYTKFHALRWR